jgi:hypothetical protein
MNQKNGNIGAGQRGRAASRAHSTDVTRLPARSRKAIDRMLTEGSTFEDVVEAINASGEAKTTLGAVEVYYRSNPSLQKERIQYQAKTARELKQACQDPDSAEAEFLQAVIMTGLVGVTRGIPSGDLERSKQDENLRLREEAFRLRSKRFALDMRMMKAQVMAGQAKMKLVASKLSQVARALKRAGGSGTLSPEMIQRIQEVYGIVSDVPKPDGQDRGQWS